MKGVYLAMLKAEKVGVFQAPQTLCKEESLVADATVFRLAGILSLPGIMLRNIEQILPCSKNKHLPYSSMSFQCC